MEFSLLRRTMNANSLADFTRKMKRFLFGILMITAMSAVGREKNRLREDNVEQVLQAMTVREKAKLCVGDGWGSMFEGLHIPLSGRHRVPGAAGETRAIRRLGIPSIILADGPAGVRFKYPGATAWPVGQSLCAGGDLRLVEEVGRAIGEEAASIGVDIMLGPGMNLTTNPLCGRNYEYFSADPVRSAHTAAAMIRGIQSAGIGACAKHFAVNRQENDRMHHDEQVDSLTLRTLYLENFRLALQEEAPWALMSAYNKVNGTHAQLSHELLTDILRDEWHFEGVVLTDWQPHLKAWQKIQAGNDLLMPGADREVRNIVRAVRNNKLSQERLDEAAGRVLRMVAKSRTLKGDRPSDFDYHYHRELCRQAGAAGCQWLKAPEKPILSGTEKVALLGSHSYYLIAGGTGSGYVNAGRRVSLFEALWTHAYELGEELPKAYDKFLKKKSSFRKVEGMSIVSKYLGQPAAKEMRVSVKQLERAITAAETVILTIGRQAGEGHDRQPTDLDLTTEEQQLLELTSRICRAQSKPLTVVLNTAGEMRIEPWVDLADAILMAWCPGQEGGLSIMDVLSR